MRKLKTMDGNAAAAHVAYAFSEVAAIYPITPSSPMAENMDEWVSQDRTNIFGEKVKIVEMQSEAGAAGAVHGALAAGALTSTFTASQGLLLMIPNMYKLAGEQTPAVFHVAARCVATHALNIFGDHSDVMGCRQTGFGMIASNSVQQAMDLAAVAHLAAIAGRVPMLHFFDGFRTSHEQQKIEVWDYEDLKEMVDWDAIKRFKQNALNPNHPHTMGSAEQPETFFQHREACNTAYLETPDLVNKYMEMVNAKIGTDYKPFNYYGAADAEEIIIAMGSVCECAEELIDYLNARGRKVGIVEVHLYRPWSTKYLLNVMPETVKKIADALGVDMNALYGDLVWDAVNNGLVSAGIERRMIADSSTEILEDSVKIQSYLSILTKAGRAKALERVYELTEIQRYVKFPLGSPAAKVEPPDAAPDAAGSAADDAAEDEPKE